MIQSGIFNDDLYEENSKFVLYQENKFLCTVSEISHNKNLMQHQQPVQSTWIKIE